MTLDNLAIAKWVTGDVSGAVSAADEALAAAEASEHPPTICVVLTNRCMLNVRRDDPNTVASDAEELRRLGTEHSMPTYVGAGQTLALWARAREFGDAEAVNGFERAVLALNVAVKHTSPFGHAALAGQQIREGQLAVAIAGVERALSFAKDSGIRCDDAWLLRLRGDGLTGSDPAAAELAYRAAIEVARVQGARTLTLLAAIPLARLLRGADRLVEAHAALAPALEGFAHARASRHRRGAGTIGGARPG